MTWADVGGFMEVEGSVMGAAAIPHSDSGTF